MIGFGILDNPNTVFKIENMGQFMEFVRWANDKLKEPPMRTPPKKYPLYFTTSGNFCGWVDRDDRNLHYYSFEDFKKLTT